MKRIAICLAGNLRKYEQFQIEWMKISSNTNTDIFLSTWDFTGKKLGVTDPSHKSYHDYNYNDTIPYSIDFLKTRGFIDVEIEPFYPTFYERFAEQIQPLWSYYRLSTPYDPYVESMKGMHREHMIAFLSMWYKRWKVFDLCNLYARTHNITYDIVMMGRPDIVPRHIEYESIVEDAINVRAGYDQEQDFDDHLAVGSFDLIREYSLLYPRFEYACRYWPVRVAENLHQPTGYLRIYLEQLNIPIHLHSPSTLNY